MEITTHALPATPKQIAYARSLAQRNRTLLPWKVQQDRRSLSAWIEAQARLKPVSDMDRLPTSSRWPSRRSSRGSNGAPSRTSAFATRGLCRSGSTGTSDSAGSPEPPPSFRERIRVDDDSLLDGLV